MLSLYTYDLDLYRQLEMDKETDMDSRLALSHTPTLSTQIIPGEIKKNPMTSSYSLGM